MFEDKEMDIIPCIRGPKHHIVPHKYVYNFKTCNKGIREKGLLF